MICSKIYKICLNVEMCEMCRPDGQNLVAAQVTLIANKNTQTISVVHYLLNRR